MSPLLVSIECPHCQGEGRIIRMASPSRLNVDPEVDHGPCHDCNGTGSLWVEASYPECAEELAEYFADDPGAEPDPLNLETA